MKKNFLIKLLYQFIFSISFLIVASQKSHALTFADPTKFYLPGEKENCSFTPTECDFGGRKPAAGPTSQILDFSKTCRSIKRSYVSPSGQAYISLCLPPKSVEGNNSSKGTRITCQVRPSDGLKSDDISTLLIITEGKDTSTKFPINKLKFTSEFTERTSARYSSYTGTCSLCGTDGQGNESTCEGFPVTGISDCEVPTYTSGTKCTFGGSGGRNNCYQENIIQTGAGSTKYLCGGSSDKTGSFEGDLVICKNNVSSITNYNQIFNTNIAGGITTYTLKDSAKSAYGCDYKSTTAVNTCELENNNSPECNFGNANESLGSNCATIAKTYSKNGKTYYCSPENKKVECDYDFPYIDVFSFSGTVMGSRIWNANIKGPNCRIYIPENFIAVGGADVSPLSPINVIKRVSSFLFYFAIFYFVVLILSNAFAYVRSGEDPTELKKIRESLFNTIAGFLFVLLSGSVIVYLISQIG